MMLGYEHDSQVEILDFFIAAVSLYKFENRKMFWKESVNNLKIFYEALTVLHFLIYHLTIKISLNT